MYISTSWEKRWLNTKIPCFRILPKPNMRRQARRPTTDRNCFRTKKVEILKQKIIVLVWVKQKKLLWGQKFGLKKAARPVAQAWVRPTSALAICVSLHWPICGRRERQRDGVLVTEKEKGIEVEENTTSIVHRQKKIVNFKSRLVAWNREISVYTLELQ